MVSTVLDTCHKDFPELDDEFLGCDFGCSQDNLAIVKFGKHNNSLYIHELIYKKGMTNRDIAQFIKKQNFRSKDVRKNVLDIAHTRTFCHQEDLEKIFAMGLAKGGSLDNAIIISGNKILNQGGLRCKNEFVKHKTLDCLGDLYLSNHFINGKITCNQGGHELTGLLLKKIFKDKKNYTIENSDLSASFREKSFNSKEIQVVV